MAGLWDRVHRNAEDRLPVHLLEASMTLYASSAFTKTQIVAALNAHLEAPLTGAEQADLNRIADNLDAKTTVALKLYYMQEVMAWTIAAEAGSVTEAAFRAGLQLL